MKVFSFCLYGNKPKYITGMHENIKTISAVFPDWKVVIYYEEDEVMMVRDSDSRINERDEWCIREFMRSPKLFHIIRDHPYHTSFIMGGLWGMKRGLLPRFLKMDQMIKVYASENPNIQGFDQHFLSNIIYPKIRGSVLIHGCVKMHPTEHIVLIPIRSQHEFCGQAIEYDDEGREYHNCNDCRALQQ